MSHDYEIPQVAMRRRRPFLVITLALVVLALLGARHGWYLDRWTHYRLITIIWTVSFVAVAFQWITSWLERPFTTDRAQQARLDRMRVTVNVPVWNEEPLVLDRVLFALFHQTRLPDRVQVVDDCSEQEDYSEVRDYWLASHPQSVEFSWVRQPQNAGKKRAQRRTFEGDPADIFVTLDSDTTLALDAIEEGLKPFASRRVQSVAGLELAWNHDTSLLTRIKSVNALIWQFVTCSSQNVLGGNVLVNRGTFALYRGSLVRDNLNAYTGETFMGRPVLLADDTMLTFWALLRGKAVQQATAVCFAVYPETISHTFRQWVRWMRGTSLRTLWRIRYLSPRSWAWWYTVLITWGYLTYISLLVAIAADWPKSEPFAQGALLATTIWTWVLASRMFAVRRSDLRTLQLAEAFLIVPIASVWMTLALRPIRLYGQLTMRKQGWVTRADGAETRSEPTAAELWTAPTRLAWPMKGNGATLMRRTLAGAAIVLVLSGCSVFRYASAVGPPRTHRRTSSETVTSKRPRYYIGVREEGFPPSWRQVSEFGRATGITPRLVLIYSGWNQPFSVHRATVALDHQAELLIQINPSNVSMARIADGSYDSYLRSYALSVRRFRHPVVIGFAHEMNGTWYSWGRTHTSSSTWVAAWRHVVTVFRRVGANNVTWLWTISHSNTTYIRSYWPGASYVDWVGIDGYLSAPADTFDSIFGPALRVVRGLTRAHVLLSEVAVGPNTTHAVADIISIFAGIRKLHLIGLVYFDVDQRQPPVHQNWRLEGHRAELAAFHRMALQLLNG